ncbi:MAG: hypothetical protein WCI48_07095 [Bacteroidota bacterium]|jgi:ABC-type cobalt transport system substrate-binding protein
MKPGGFRNPEYILLAAVFILLMVLSFLSQGYYGGADNINHYFLSRYSWTYPKLFLDPWGRPMYTILASPFALFGFQGIKVFNIILGTLSAFFLMKTVKILKAGQPWMAIVILVFSPLYMIMLFTAMTEILFGFLLIFSAYLFFSNRYIAAAIAISFLPFARSEGYFMIAFMFLGLLMRKEWKAIIFLGSGFAFFSIIGAWQYKDLFWVIRNNPYPLIHAVYHTPGPFWSFIRQTDTTFGAANLLFICLGIIVLVAGMFNGASEKRNRYAEVLMMFLLPVLAYYFFHSWMYFKGWAGSLGFIRVTAGVIPLASMIALYGISWLLQLAGNRRWLRLAINILVVLLILFFNFKTYRYPFALSKEEKVIKTAAVWVKSEFSPIPVVFYNDLNVPYFLDSDPYNHKKILQLWDASSITSIPFGAVYIWDSHFGPNECRIPFDTVMRDPYMRLIKVFRPKQKIMTYGDRPYEIYIFIKKPETGALDNYFIARGFLEQEDGKLLP